MVRNLYAPRADKRDLRDDSTKAKQDSLAQRREGRDLEDGRAVIKALEKKLEGARAGHVNTGKQNCYVETSRALQLVEQQLKDEQKKVSSS